HERGGAKRGTDRGELAGGVRDVGDAEVADLDMAGVEEEQVAGFEIAVDDPVGGCGSQGVGGLQGYRHHKVQRHALRMVGEDGAQVTAAQQLHDEEQLAFVVAEVVDSGDIGVLDVGGDTGLALEASNEDTVVVPAKDELDGNLAFQVRVE